MVSKPCSKCKEDKPLDQYYRRKGYKDGIQSTCKKCHSEGLTRRKPSYRQAKAWNLKRIYGITLEQYDQMCADQEHKCKICQSIPEILYVDHCHTTGAIRGLLCKFCNAGLGCFRDSPESLDAAKKYLIGW